MIAIIDYNVGNLHNLKNALDYLGLPNRFARKPGELEGASHVILPGVGAFSPAMEHLRAVKMDRVALQAATAGIPFMGVCVGMQLMFEGSEEDGQHQGLGILPGRNVRFKDSLLKIPQIGWNRVAWQRDDPLVAKIPTDSYFYFVHSYHAALADAEDGLGLTDYGGLFPAVVRRKNVYGCQFHPEKSQHAGLRRLKNFASLKAS